MTKSAEIRANGMARLQSAVSRTPGLGPWVMVCDSPSFAPSTVHVLGVRADTIAQWVGFDCDKRSGDLPRYYKSVGVIGVNAAMLDAKEAELRGDGIDVIHATAYESDNYVIAHKMRNRTKFEYSESDGMYKVAMRRGPKTLNATAGLLAIHDMSFHVLKDSLSDEGTLLIPEVRMPTLII